MTKTKRQKSLRKEKPSRRQKSTRVPYHYKPDYLSYEEWQIALRRQFAFEQRYSIKNIGEHPVYSDFEVSSDSRKTYKVALRGATVGSHFCSCPDFAINTLGTCKHIEYVIYHLKKKKQVAKLFNDPYVQPYSSIFLRYSGERKVVFKIGSTHAEDLKKLATNYFDSDFILQDIMFDHFEDFVEKALKLDPQLRCYKDALDYIVDIRAARKRKELIERKYSQGKDSPELLSIVKTKLHPYQKEAALFAAKTGRCIIADEMGLGKTLEAIAAAEIMAGEFALEKVLIICPTSLKYQWKAEIEKFSHRSALVIEGLSSERKQQYFQPEFFKIVTYDTVKNDLEIIQKMSPDLVILDEAQRIKNWKTKTAQMVKKVKSEYAIVLTGTPLENRLEELHSITEFVDRFRLGPLFRFLANHQIVNKTGKIVGYKELHQVAKTIAPILIRRTKKEVMQELPARTDKNCYVPTTKQQKKLHDEHQTAVSRLVNKWKRCKFLSEKERQILLIHLNCMRMVSDSTYVLDQKTRFDTKIDELMILLDEVFEMEGTKRSEVPTSGKKVVIFSQWERMTRLVAQELDKRNIGYAYLHGGVPAIKRKDLLINFHKNEQTKVFLSTDAGSVGLNLQCASFLINLDCPWNPAVLEQRIARIHRFGQKEPINVVNFISSGTIEEMILEIIKFKKSVFEGVLDNGADEVFMGENKFQQFMKGIEKMVPVEQESQSAQDEKQTGQPLVAQSVEAAPVLAESENQPAETQTIDAIDADTITADSRVHGSIAKSEKPENSEKETAMNAIANPSLNDLFTVGLNFLEQLTKNMSQQTNAGDSSITDGITANSRAEPADKSGAAHAQGVGAFSSFIEKDHKTGKTSLKIPMPDEVTLTKAAGVLEAFVKALRK